MTPDEIVHRLISDDLRDIEQIEADDLIFYLEYLGGQERQWKREVLLRLALHFTPKQALARYRDEDHDYTDYHSDKEPYQMIIQYIENNCNFSESESKKVGEIFGGLWYAWVEERKNINKKKRKALKSKLKREQNNRCNNCGVKLGDEKNSAAYNEEDHFKPIHEFVHPQMDGELDHKEPVSQFGQNDSGNFQLLCRFCNQGKKDDIAISIDDRLSIATKDPSDVDSSLRRSLFYEVTSDCSECTQCGNQIAETELTIQMKSSSGCLTTSSLQAVCVDCLDDSE
jgi:hypothetical protein